MKNKNKGSIASKKGNARVANNGNLYVGEKWAIESEVYAHYERDNAWENKRLCFPFDCRPDGLFYQIFDEWKVFFKFQSASFISYEEDETKQATVFVIERNEDGNYNFSSYELKENGDWRSKEVNMIMNDSDIVIANPCGKQIKDFVPHVVGVLQKKILVLNSHDFPTYKEINDFIYNENNKLRAGYTANFQMKFIIKDEDLDSGVGYHYEKVGTNSGKKYTKAMSRWWWTNLDMLNAPKTPITMMKYEDMVADGNIRRMKYYDAIEVSAVRYIPCDYYGTIAVPETFYKEFNYDEWEILDANDYRINSSVKEKPYGCIKDAESVIIAKNENGEWIEVDKQRRILIRRKIK